MRHAKLRKTTAKGDDRRHHKGQVFNWPFVVVMA